MHPTSDTEFLSITKLAERLSVSRNTVYAWMEAGCPHLKVGGVTRFVLPEVVEWMRERSRDGDEAA